MVGARYPHKLQDPMSRSCRMLSSLLRSLPRLRFKLVDVLNDKVSNFTTSKLIGQLMLIFSDGVIIVDLYS